MKFPIFTKECSGSVKIFSCWKAEKERVAIYKHENGNTDIMYYNNSWNSYSLHGGIESSAEEFYDEFEKALSVIFANLR